MLRCASSFVTATYEKVGLIPQALRALPLEHLIKSFCRLDIIFDLKEIHYAKNGTV
jgi:hypothetical protein